MVHNWTIYMYTFPNGKKYIGATMRPLYLRQGSRESGWSRYKNCKRLWKVIQEFGVASIKQDILFEGEIEDSAASDMERFYIAQNHSDCEEYGYNIGSGGEGTQERHLSEERKEQLRKQMDELHAAKVGTHPSYETRYRQRKTKLGTKRGPMSEETKRKIGFSNSLATMTDEERERRSNSQKQPVEAFSWDRGETLYFECGEDAAAYFGVAGSMISRWIKGTRIPKNGYTFSKAMA